MDKTSQKVLSVQLIIVIIIVNYNYKRVGIHADNGTHHYKKFQLIIINDN